MTSLPLHPALVHIPLGLAFVMPFLALGFAWALWTRRVGARAWVVVLLLQALLLAAGLVAMNTGEREEDRVERVVPEAAISRHEAYAEQFVWATGLTLALASLVLVLRRPTGRRALAVASVVGTVVVAGAALRVGHAGGQLVYLHNAGAAYAVSGGGSQQAAADSAARATDTSRDHDESDEEK